jgi:DNA-binding transcriptional LysR family regulator
LLSIIMELGHLWRFYQVATAGGFTKAARAVRAQQPGLSRAVAILERDLGVQLFDRGTRSVTLTRVGRDVYALCEEIFSRVAAVEAVASRERSELHGPLRFGATSELSADVLPVVTARFFEKHPEVWPMAFVGPAAPALDRVANGDLELALYFHVPKRRPEISIRSLTKVPFRLVVDTRKRKDPIVLASFIGSREIDDVATRHYPTLDRVRRDRPEARIRLSSNDASTRRAWVRMGIGVSVLPLHMVVEDLRSGALTALYEEEDFRFDLYSLTRARHRLSKPAAAYLEAVRLELTAAQIAGRR